MAGRSSFSLSATCERTCLLSSIVPSPLPMEEMAVQSRMRKRPGAAVPISLNGVRRYRLAAEIMQLGDPVRTHCSCGELEADRASGSLVPLGFVVLQGTVDLFVRRTCMNGQLRSKRFRGNCEIREPGRFRIIARGKNSSVHSRRKSAEQTGRSARGLRICLGWLRLLHAIVWDGIPKPGGPSSMKHNVPVFSAKPGPMRFVPRKRLVLQRLCIALWQTHSWAPTIKRGIAGTAERKLRPRTGRLQITNLSRPALADTELEREDVVSVCDVVPFPKSHIGAVRSRVFRGIMQRRRLVGSATELSPGTYQFTDVTADNSQRFYRVRSP
jgi:hypothetical protein